MHRKVLSTEVYKSKLLTTALISSMVLSGNTLQAAVPSIDNATVIMPASDQITVKMKVTDQNGSPIIGANIKEKGHKQGSITDINGEATLKVTRGARLIVSYIGFGSKEVTASPNLSIQLEDQNHLLNEVVAIGYGTQKKVNLTGAVATVDVGKTLDSRPITDIGRALQGSVPGLIVTTSSGELGSAPTIKIRGSVSSPNGSGNPLILVDNVEIDDISMVNPDDIESISVLKDAASASIYGARGAFGVILITTKTKEKHERVSIKYTNSFAWRKPTKHPEQLPGWQQADINLQGAINQTKGSATYYDVVGNMRIDAESVQKMKDYWDKYGYGDQFGNEMQEGRDFEFRNGFNLYRTWDWYDMYIKNWSPQQSHNLALNGGNGRTNYNVALGYIRQDGMMKINSDKYKRYNANVSLNSDINKYVTVRATLMYAHEDYDSPFSYGSGLYDPLYYLYRWQPIYPYGTFEGKDFRSALTELKNAPISTRDRDFFRLTGGITLKPFKGFTVDVDATYSSFQTASKSYGTPSKVWGYNIFSAIADTDALRNNYSNYVTSSYDYVQETQRKAFKLASNIVLTYSYKWRDHDFKVMGGSNIEKFEAKYTLAKRMNLLDPNKPELNMATGDQTTDSEHSWWSVAGFFARINYTYKDKYLLELNGRYDGSSRFPSGSRFAFFPSLSAGYRISEEKFMQKLKPVLSTLKLRGSWGMIGNQDVGTNRFISTLSTSQDSWIIDGIHTQSTQMPTIVSSKLTWEKVKTLDFGFDARFFNDDFGITFDWYKRTTSDILTTANLPLVLGAAAPYENMGAIETPGWELAVDYRHTFENGFNFNVTASVSDYTTKVTKWTDITSIPTYSAGSGWWSSAYYKKGMVLGDIWGLQFDRFLTKNDFNSDGSLKAGIPDQTQVFPSGYKLSPGDVLYKDLDGNNKITKGTSTQAPGDLSVIGNALPRYQVSLNLGAAWKGFDLNMFFYGVAKNNLWAAGNQVLPGFTSGEPYYKGAEDYWTEDNPDAFYPRPMIYDQAMSGNYQINDRYLLNMAYIRLKSLTFGYTFPKQWLSRFKIQSLRVYFTGENLITIDGLKPAIDPEIGIRVVSGRSDPRNFGRSYPYQKTLSFGIQLNL